MTLLKCTTKRILFAMTIFVLAGGSLTAKGKLTLPGQVFDSDGDKVKKAKLTLRKGGDVVEEDKTKGNGKFKFKKLAEGDYVLEVAHEDLGSAEKAFTLSDDYDLGEIALSTEKPSTPVATETSSAEAASVANDLPTAVSVSVPQTIQAMGSSNTDFILNELNFEIKKLNAVIN